MYLPYRVRNNISKLHMLDVVYDLQSESRNCFTSSLKVLLAFIKQDNLGDQCLENDFHFSIELTDNLKSTLLRPSPISQYLVTW